MIELDIIEMIYPELYQKMEETKENIALRIVIVKNDKGEEIRLATNLSREEFNYEEIVELYKLRWNIELNYHCLKESLKIETITSSNDIIIEQDIYSQMLVYNLIQAFKQDAEKNIDQSKYKNEMKINMNMAVGFVKKALLKIILETNDGIKDRMFDLLEQKIEKYLVPKKALLKIILETNDGIKDRMFDLLEQKIEKYLVPIKKDRHYPRNHSKNNKYSINKRKSF